MMLSCRAPARCQWLRWRQRIYGCNGIVPARDWGRPPGHRSRPFDRPHLPAAPMNLRRAPWSLAGTPMPDWGDWRGARRRPPGTSCPRDAARDAPRSCICRRTRAHGTGVQSGGSLAQNRRGCQGAFPDKRASARCLDGLRERERACCTAFRPTSVRGAPSRADLRRANSRRMGIRPACARHRARDTR
jgi:hypothetical protein